MQTIGLANAAMGPSGTLGRLVEDSTTIRARLDRLTEQSSTGLVSQSFGGLGSTAQLSLDLRPQLARVDVLTQNITAASARTDVSSQVLDQLQQIASTFFNGTISMSTQTAQEVDTLAAQASAALTQVQGLLNTKVGDDYVFSGEDSGNPPLPDAAFGAYVQSIRTATAGLTAVNGAATAAATLAAANSGSPFSATLAAARQTVAVGFGITAQIGIVAGQNAYASTTVPGSTGSYVRDLVRSLATISALNSAQTSFGASFDTLVSNTRASLADQITMINADVAGLGDSKQLLTMNQGTLDDTRQAMTTQISNVENVDAAATASAVTQTQTQLQISYKLIASMQGLSLVQYL